MIEVRDCFPLLAGRESFQVKRQAIKELKSMPISPQAIEPHCHRRTISRVPDLKVNRLRRLPEERQVYGLYDSWEVERVAITFYYFAYVVETQVRSGPRQAVPGMCYRVLGVQLPE